jgi:Na+/H+ antiporter NhaD/arsenite permease-like protein
VYDLLTLSLLILMIILVSINKPSREYIGLILILTLLLTKAITPYEFIKYVNWDVLGLIIGMNIFSVLLEESGLVKLLSDKILSHTYSYRKILFLLTLSSGIISIALENVTVVLLMAPIVFMITDKTGYDPAPIIIGVALASNMAGSATMIGDPPAIIVAGHYNLSFIDFIIHDVKPSMFFITLIPMIISTYIYTLLVPEQKIVNNKSNTIITNNTDKSFLVEATIFLTIKITLLSIRNIIELPLTLIATIGVGGLILTRIILHNDIESAKKGVRQGFDWKLIVFLIGIFVLSGAFAKYGLARRFAEFILGVAGNNLFYITSILIWISVAFSAVMDNTPYVVTMLPVIDDIVRDIGADPLTIVWALLLGATLGGGITYIGASANLIAIRLLEKKGRKVSFLEFIRKSLPFNLSNIIIGWIIYSIFWL